MKNLLLIALTLVLLSCEKEAEVITEAIEASNTIQLTNDSGIIEMFETVVYCYIGEDVSKQISLGHIDINSTTNKIEIDNRVEKVKVTFRISNGVVMSDRFETIAYTFINAGNNAIFVDETTQVRLLK